MMFPQSRHSGSSHLPQQLKFTTSDSCDLIKDEFQLLQAQYHSLKIECDKLASEKSEMQRHYVMYYVMSYSLNIQMHKQTFSQRRYTNGHETHERCSTSLITKEMQINTTIRYHFILIQTAIIKNPGNSKCW
uniref:Groucho/TLE N-terminal Q-rich domain-containing protein n=1 Tax=Piliocolobus tephrosceles TaxID=591936 RepID=A0A8C9LL02_9PRIM